MLTKSNENFEFESYLVQIFYLLNFYYKLKIRVIIDFYKAD
jgi:hypothetical protein